MFADRLGDLADDVIWYVAVGIQAGRSHDRRGGTRLNIRIGRCRDRGLRIAVSAREMVGQPGRPRAAPSRAPRSGIDAGGATDTNQDEDATDLDIVTGSDVVTLAVVSALPPIGPTPHIQKA